MAVADWSTTAADNGTTLGINIAEGCPAGNINGAIRELMAQIKAGFASIPTGTVMLFAQTSAPTGWTKSTAHDNKALRVVSGTASSGGSVNFTAAFASQAVSGTTGSHVLTEDEIPGHTHYAGVCDNNGLMFNRGSVAASPTASAGIDGSDTGTLEAVTSSTGGGSGHTHTFSATAINLAVKYVDVILATKAA